jgi:putative ABC transport system substrate-binding protein
MRDLGWIEGQNLMIEHRWAEGDPRRLRALAQELVQRHVDVLVAVGNPGIAAAQQATATIPIVMAASADPMRSGFVRNLARPEANITGLSLESQDLHGKRLELLKETVSSLRKVAILSNPSHPAHADYIRESEAAARILRVETLVLAAGQVASVETAVRAAAQAKADALLVLSDPLVLDAAGPRISALAQQHRLATLYAWRQLTEGGGLLSYGTDLAAMHRRSAFYVDRLLKGWAPADLPVEQPTRFELVINLKTARAIGLRIPPSLLLRADHVVE